LVLSHTFDALPEFVLLMMPEADRHTARRKIESFVVKSTRRPGSNFFIPLST
jgi:hypothetical protein